MRFVVRANFITLRHPNCYKVRKRKRDWKKTVITILSFSPSRVSNPSIWGRESNQPLNLYSYPHYRHQHFLNSGIQKECWEDETVQYLLRLYYFITYSGGGGTRTHKRLRAAVFKTAALPIRSTPPEFKLIFDHIDQFLRRGRDSNPR